LTFTGLKPAILLVIPATIGISGAGDPNGTFHPIIASQMGKLLQLSSRGKQRK